MNLLPPPGPARWRLLAMLAILAVMVVYFVPPIIWPEAPASIGPTGPTGPAAAPAAVTRAAQNKKNADTPVPVQLASLDNTTAIVEESSRNPFKFGEPPKPPPPPPPPPQPIVYTPPPQPLPPPPPQVKLTLLGCLQDDQGAWLARLKDANGVTFSEFEGQIIDGKYRLVKVQKDSVVVSFLDGSGRRTLQVGSGG